MLNMTGLLCVTSYTAAWFWGYVIQLPFIPVFCIVPIPYMVLETKDISIFGLQLPDDVIYLPSALRSVRWKWPSLCSFSSMHEARGLWLITLLPVAQRIRVAVRNSRSAHSSSHRTTLKARQMWWAWYPATEWLLTFWGISNIRSLQTASTPILQC